MNRQQRVVLLFGLLLISAAMLGRANEARSETAALGHAAALVDAGPIVRASPERERRRGAASNRLQP